ncbi:MAG: NAD(P)H-hydrate epimerase, partial [Paludibacter sp.]
MKIFATSQIREIDQLTIKNEAITSIDLMERAADVLYEKYLQTISYNCPVCIMAGPGNNGGDALALARMFLLTSLKVEVYLIHTGSLSDDCKTNKKRLFDSFPENLIELQNEFIAPVYTEETIIIDGLFGSGLSRPLTGIFAEAVNWMNQSGCKIVSIDIPSGLQGEENISTNSSDIVKADLTFTFQFPKLSFLFAENEPYIGKWEILDIGLHPEAIKQTASDYHYLEENEIKLLLKIRSKFSHKGTYGHALIIAGSYGMAGASVLSGRAALRTGAGLVTVHGCASNRTIIQTAVPE